jgi:predicted RNA-binding protein with PUA-like domain
MGMRRSYWLVKSEPKMYSWDEFVRDGTTYGVRNYQARNHLRSMRIRDAALFYHSNEGKEIVGVAEVTREAYPDPTTKDPRWVVVDLDPIVQLARPVALDEIKADPDFEGIPLIRQSRLSVMPVEKRHFDRILKLAKTRLPRR